MHNVRVVYMGTPDFSIKPLEYLKENAKVVLVVSKKDAFVGRKKILTPSPVKKYALDNDIPVLTPDSLKKEYKQILDYKPDIIVTCAYGKILPKELLDYPKYGCINIHASILPKYRGAAPIQWAIMNGEKQTGVTLMYMDEGMDTGDIIDVLKCPILDSDDVGSLHDKLSLMGQDILAKNLDDIIKKTAKRKKQKEKLASYAPLIEREMEEIDFHKSGKEIINKIRAFSPWPLAKTTIMNDEIKIIKAHFIKHKNTQYKAYYLSPYALGIGCSDGIIELDIIKPCGKNVMDIKSYMNGKKI